MSNKKNEDDPIITSQGTIILEEIDDDVKVYKKYEDDPIITSQGTIILEENVDDYIRSIEREEVEQLIARNKEREKIEKKTIDILSPIEEETFGRKKVN